MTIQWKFGDTYKGDDVDCWTSGIHIQKVNESGKVIESHGNAIECFGLTEKEATDRRDLILACMKQLTFIKVVSE